MPYDPTGDQQRLELTANDRSVPQVTPEGKYIEPPPTQSQQYWELMLKDPSFRDRLIGAGETAMMVGTSPIGYLAGILGAGYGAATGKDPRETGAKWEHASTYQPQTPVGQYYGEQVGEKLNALPPVVSGIPHMRLGPKAGRFAAETYAKPVAEMASDLYMAGQIPGVPNAASYVVDPKGNLNFRPSITGEMFKGPETQPVSSFLNQAQGIPGMTASGLETGFGPVRALDPNEKVTKGALTDQVRPSEYEKVDLKGASDDHFQHYLDLAQDQVDQDPTHGGKIWGEMGFARSMIPALENTLRVGDFSELTDMQKRALERKGYKTYDHFESDFFDKNRELSHDLALELMERDERNGITKDDYAYREEQRLQEPTMDDDRYFEIGVTHPDYKDSYRHYGKAPKNTIGHIRGSFFPDPAETGQTHTSLQTGQYTTRLNDPGAMLIEEIQSDPNQGAKQTGPLHQVHGVLFKAAIQHALENGAKTVYMPTAKAIATARSGKPERYAPVYDQQIVKEGITPLKKIKGVTVTKVFADPGFSGAGSEHHMLDKIDFTPEAIEHILKGEGQKLPGYKIGGFVNSFRK